MSESLHEILVSAGAVFEDESGTEVVTRFTDTEQAALATREGAGMGDLSHRPLFQVTGKDRASYLQKRFGRSQALVNFREQRLVRGFLERMEP